MPLPESSGGVFTPRAPTQTHSRSLLSAAIASLLLLAIPLSAADTNLGYRLNPLQIDGPVPYFIATGLDDLGYQPRDAELAEWALEAWSRATGGILCFHRAAGTDALVRIYWSPVGSERFGQMQTIPVKKKRGGEVYVRPRIEEFEHNSSELAALSASDPLFRDAVVYLTLLHEIGHVLGLVHSADLRDAMYYGGDPLRYFREYRNRLSKRSDMLKFTGLSATDIARVRRLYPPTMWYKPKPPAQPDHKRKGMARAGESTSN